LLGGLPHSETHGSTPARGSPWLFAACCVLHRLSVPRHPPDALLTLDLSSAPRAGTTPPAATLPMLFPCATGHRPRPGAPRRVRTPVPAADDIRPSLAPGPPLRAFLQRGRSSDRPRSRTLFTMSQDPVASCGRDIPARPEAWAGNPFSSAGYRRSRPRVPRPPGPGGGDRDRTDDLMLAKHALSQLSYAPVGPGLDRADWWAREDLNLRPHAYQARALTN
jgi:hypothetical protein